MPFAKNVRLVGYHDLGSKPGFKLGMQEKGGRWYLYVAHLWEPGWSILDVTDPAKPELARFIPGPPNTWTIQLQVADGKLITGLERVAPGWGGDPNGPPHQEGFYIWDVSDPTDPKKLGHWQGGGDGCHRNYYDGGRYVHASAHLKGFNKRQYVCVDIDDPEHPRIVGQWWFPGQNTAAGERFSEADAHKHVQLHGPAYVEGDYAYCSWEAAGMVILDVRDLSAPKLAGHLPIDPPFSNMIPCHTALPLPDRQLVVINGESIKERCDEPLVMAGIVDVHDIANPRLISVFPLPEVPDGCPPDWFHTKGGRFGPHNQHQPQHQRCLQPSGDYIFMTYFNAGLQVFDIANPQRPVSAGYYIPDDPKERLGALPRDLVHQAEDVVVDARGYIYMTEKNSGIHIMEFNPAA
ncbi:MAG TPA: hypothetical protein VK009_22075 [Chloroflexota bacterium]|nr:hypothetical protein [Chloroflexota bacterium]